ncbi:MAG: hypothetical protein Q9165_008731 [Trypethelium subeluteriae]
MGTKAPKITDLIVFYVVFYCSDGCKNSPSEASTGIQSIVVIAQTLPEEVRQEWVRGKAPIFRKLCENSLQTRIHPQVRSWTIVFISSLCDAGKIPRQIFAAYEFLLLDTSVLSMTANEYRSLLQQTVEKMELSLTSAFASTFLEQAFSLVVNGDDSLVRLTNFRTLASAVVEIAQGSSSSRKNILLAFCTNKLSPYVTTFLNFITQIDNKMDNCLRGDLFARPLMKQRAELGAVLCSTLLKLALLAQGDHDIGIDPTTALALVDKQTTFNTVITSLAHPHPSLVPNKGSQSLLQQTSTPRRMQENNNWKVLLSNELRRRALDQEDMIIQSVAQTCRDFEERCEDVESPLRLQQEKTAVLQQKFEDTQNTASELEIRLLDRESRISGLKAENSEYSDALRQAETVGESLKSRLSDLGKELLERNEKHSIEIRQIQKEYSERVVTVEATFAIKDGTIQAQITQIQELENAQRSANVMVEQKLRDLEEARNREREQSQQLQSLRSELEAEKAYQLEQHEACMDAYRKIDCIDQDAKSARSALFLPESEVRQLRDAKTEAELTEKKRSYEAAAQQTETKLEDLRDKVRVEGNTRLIVAKEGREAELRNAHDKLRQIGGLTNLQSKPTEQRTRLHTAYGSKLDIEPVNQSRPRHTAGNPSSETPSSQIPFVDTTDYSSTSKPLKLATKSATMRSDPMESFKTSVTGPSGTRDSAARTRRTGKGTNRPPLEDTPANRTPSRNVGKPSRISQGYLDSQRSSLDVSILPANESEMLDLGLAPEYSFDENDVLAGTVSFSAYDDGQGAGESANGAIGDVAPDEQENF